MAKKKNTEMTVLGLMSGTSLDGLDLALCRFNRLGGRYVFKILAAKTVTYSPAWKKRLSGLKDAYAAGYFETDAAYADFVAEQVNAFLKSQALTAEAIASHGHTVFHQPAKGFTTQLGSGAVIAARTGITTVCDFRSLDVALRGQGAPLVPVGDQLLFPEHDACLNIGGIANISFDRDGERLAFDICEANMLLNYLAGLKRKAYDRDGRIAAAGTPDQKLLRKLDALKYYTQTGAKSIGREWFEKNVKATMDQSRISIEDKLSTATLHIANKVAAELNRNKIKQVLVTGGGAFNKFLIEQIRRITTCRVIVPGNEIVNFKEALLFAFLGYLRLQERVNTLESVTGALRDSAGGAVYFGWKGLPG